MRRSVRKLATYSVSARDGPVGSVADLYVQDPQWVIRYIAVATSDGGRRALISPIGVADANWDERRLLVAHTEAKVRSAPEAPAESRMPRSLEIAVNRHYGLLPYWLGANLWGNSDRPRALGEAGVANHIGQGDASEGVPEIRSALGLLTFGVRAEGDAVGVLRDLLFDERTWQLTGMVVAHQEQRSRLVEISAGTVDRISWADRTIEVRGDAGLRS